MVGKTHKMVGQSCPICDANLDRATSTDRNKKSPQVGDVTVCVICSTTLEWTLGMVLQVSDKRDDEGRIDLIKKTIRNFSGGLQ